MEYLKKKIEKVEAERKKNIEGGGKSGDSKDKKLGEEKDKLASQFLLLKRGLKLILYRC